MNVIDAVLIIEGDTEADEETQLEAWQYLVDSGMAWRLQGRIGRAADALIASGQIAAPVATT